MDGEVTRDAIREMYYQWWLLQRFRELSRRLLLSYLPDRDELCDEPIVVQEG